MELQSVMHKRCSFPTSTVRTCRKRRDKSLLFYTCLASYSHVVDMMHGTRQYDTHVYPRNKQTVWARAYAALLPADAKPAKEKGRAPHHPPASTRRPARASVHGAAAFGSGPGDHQRMLSHPAPHSWWMPRRRMHACRLLVV